MDGCGENAVLQAQINSFESFKCIGFVHVSDLVVINAQVQNYK